MNHKVKIYFTNKFFNFHMKKKLIKRSVCYTAGVKFLTQLHILLLLLPHKNWP